MFTFLLSAWWYCIDFLLIWHCIIISPFFLKLSLSLNSGAFALYLTYLAETIFHFGLWWYYCIHMLNNIPLSLILQCGGVRLWNYERMEDFLRDGLRLAQGMGLKSALAGLWYVRRNKSVCTCCTALCDLGNLCSSIC